MNEKNDRPENQQHHQSKHHPEHSTFADHVRAAELADDLWKSGDPHDWDRALELREEVSKSSPRAWEYAMKEIRIEEEEEGEAERRLPPHQRIFEPGEIRGLRAYETGSGHIEIREAPNPYARREQMRNVPCLHERDYIDFHS
jgi:hypothetical protein